jgi:toxin YoeB
MNVLFTKSAWEEYLHWQENDKKINKRINQLIKDIMRNSSDGLGKPEPLKFSLSGYWSRRINDEHRLVYKVENDQIYIIQGRYHY